MWIEAGDMPGAFRTGPSPSYCAPRRTRRLAFRALPGAPSRQGAHRRPDGRPSETFPSSMNPLRKTSLRIAHDLVPRVLRRLGVPAGGEPRASRREADDYCLQVPFRHSPSAVPVRPVAVVCHLFHADLADWALELAAHIPFPADLYISTDTIAKRDAIARACTAWTGGRTEIRVVPNRGRDIAPKLITFADVYDQHDLILFLHSKRTDHYAAAGSWRDFLTDAIVGSEQVVSSIIEIFTRRSDVGIVAPQHFPPLRSSGHIQWGGNFLAARRLAWRMGFDIPVRQPMDMTSGSMFWARATALRPLLGLHLQLSDFPEEAGQLNGTTAHAIERLFLHACEHAGLTWVKVVDPRRLDDTSRTVAIHAPDDLDAFVARHRYDLLDRRGSNRWKEPR